MTGISLRKEVVKSVTVVILFSYNNLRFSLAYSMYLSLIKITVCTVTKFFVSPFNGKKKTISYSTDRETRLRGACYVLLLAKVQKQVHGKWTYVLRIGSINWPITVHILCQKYNSVGYPIQMPVETTVCGLVCYFYIITQMC